MWWCHRVVGGAQGIHTILIGYIHMYGATVSVHV